MFGPSPYLWGYSELLIDIYWAFLTLVLDTMNKEHP